MNSTFSVGPVNLTVLSSLLPWRYASIFHLETAVIRLSIRVSSFIKNTRRPKDIYLDSNALFAVHNSCVDPHFNLMKGANQTGQRSVMDVSGERSGLNYVLHMCCGWRRKINTSTSTQKNKPLVVIYKRGRTRCCRSNSLKEAA